MRINFIIKIIFFSLILYSNSFAEIRNSIVAKIGNKIITSIDIENEIKTILILSNKELNQDNIEKTKNFAVQSIIRSSLKRGEVDKFKITTYNEKDYKDYIKKIATGFNLKVSELDEFFKINDISFEAFKDKYKTELLWNTLIFSLYKNQVTVNTYEVEKQLTKSLKKNKNMNLNKEKIKEEIVNKQKREKLNLFSRSHYSSLENTVLINFK
ncbi:hypothetical protein OAM66_02380 [Pelagibacteraceae bacterium]|jgi:hypothetical protein|nr:hypothetical protein [Pelagibacteraceae bacterium]|tara:strand:+ start:5341 stop:5976 length:636 start_codon:yes stop_codon:yes gene_type:complete